MVLSKVSPTNNQAQRPQEIFRSDVDPAGRSEFIFTDPRRGPYAREFGGLGCEACHILASADKALQQTTISALSATDLQTIITSELSLDARLGAWSERAAAGYKFEKMATPNTSSPVNAHPLQPNISIHLYNSPLVAYMWNQYRCTRIMLLQSMLSCSLQQGSNNPWEPPSLQVNGTSIPVVEQIQELVNDVFASVPYLLDEVDRDGNLKTAQQNKAVPRPNKFNTERLDR